MPTNVVVMGALLAFISVYLYGASISPSIKPHQHSNRAYETFAFHRAADEGETGRGIMLYNSAKRAPESDPFMHESAAASSQRNPLFRTRVIANFWPRADEARARYEQFIGDPGTHSFHSEHQCWDYWFMPEVYCYLRTDATKVLGTELIDDFLTRLEELGHSELNGVSPRSPVAVSSSRWNAARDTQRQLQWCLWVRVFIDAETRTHLAAAKLAWQEKKFSTP